MRKRKRQEFFINLLKHSETDVEKPVQELNHLALERLFCSICNGHVMACKNRHQENSDKKARDNGDDNRINHILRHESDKTQVLHEKQKRNKHDNRRQVARNNGRNHFLHAQDCRNSRLCAAHAVRINVVNHHDGRIDHHAYPKNQPSQRHDVQRNSHKIHQKERDDNGKRD